MLLLGLLCYFFANMYTQVLFFFHLPVKIDKYDVWKQGDCEPDYKTSVFWRLHYKGKFRTIASVLFLHVNFFSVLFFTLFTTMWVLVLVHSPLSNSRCFTYIVCVSMFKCCVLVVSGGKHGNCGCQQIGRRVATANHPVPCIWTKDLGNCTEKRNKGRGLSTQ